VGAPGGPRPAARTRLSPQTPSRYALGHLRRQPRLPVTRAIRRDQHQRQPTRRGPFSPSRRSQTEPAWSPRDGDGQPPVRHVPRSDLTVPLHFKRPRVAAGQRARAEQHRRNERRLLLPVVHGQAAYSERADDSPSAAGRGSSATFAVWHAARRRESEPAWRVRPNAEGTQR
jgi:hypothetical protein